MALMRTRRPAWKILLIGLGTVLALAGAFVVWVQRVAARRWEALQKRIPELVAEARARDPRRPVLRGEAVPGNAWADYSPALAPLKAAFKLDDLKAVIERRPAADLAKAKAIVAGHEQWLDLLRAGARRPEGTYAVSFEKGMAADLPPLSGSHALVALAVCKARFLRQEGREEQACDLLLDAAQFSADLGRNTVLIGRLVSLALQDQVFTELKAGPPDPEVARGLAVLDAAWPDLGESFLNEAAAATATLAGTETPGVGPWPYGFSSRIMLADAAESHLALTRRAAEASRWAWDDPRRKAGSPEDDPETHPNPVLSLISPPGSAHRQDRERRAQLRLLRRYHGEAGPLEDPFGGQIRSDGIKAWSIGADGVDDAGAGAWKPAPKGDLVLDLQKK